jgi:hypothetical protein
VAPTGQYDGTRLINWGNNRWGFKPELGYSQRCGNWVVDAYGGARFYTTNPEFFSNNVYFPGTRNQSVDPMAVLEGHLSYDFKPRLWVSLDANFWHGGETSSSGVPGRDDRCDTNHETPITNHCRSVTATVRTLTMAGISKTSRLRGGAPGLADRIEIRDERGSSGN